MVKSAILIAGILGLATSSAISPPSMSTPTAPKRVLYDIPISNNGARCRIIMYKKGIPESEVAVETPFKLGGFKSEGYLAVNPQGKVPALHCTATGLKIAESDTISRFLLSEYADLGPSFQPDNPISNMIQRFHDVYLASIQTCLYRASPPFGLFQTRRDALAEYSKQLYVIADLMDKDGPYLCGKEVSLADAAVFPSIVFAAHALPKFDHGIEKAIPAVIEEWFERLKSADDVFQKVYDEVKGGLVKWDESGRWDTIHLAGVRDNEPSTIFDRIIAGEIPSTIVKEDDKILAFKDVNPVAPAHVLVIPKVRDGLTRLSKATSEHVEILGRLLLAAGEIAKDESLGFGDGARIVINDGNDGGQEVYHLHVHVLGGTKLTWPPG